jgi:hypothetical protein
VAEKNTAAEENFQKLLSGYGTKNAGRAFGGGGMASVSAASAKAPRDVRDALESITAEYTGRGGTLSGTRGEGIAGQLPGQIQERATAGRQAPAAQQGSAFNLDAVLDQMYRTVGGPNAALIAQYNAQKEQLQENYSQNKADANNLYGQLSSDIETYGAGLQERYTTDIEGMATAEAERQQGLEDLQSQRDADRARVAASLGIGVEDAQTPQSSALQEIAGLSSAAASNWENLFKANKLLADASTGRQVAGAGATKANQLMAMKRFLDAQNQAIDSQIAMERMKTPTQELTDFGKFAQPAMFGEQLRQLQGIAPEIFGPGEQPGMSSFGEKVAGAQQYFAETGKNYNSTQIQDMISRINEYMNMAGQRGVPGAIASMGGLTADETILAEILGINPSRS